MSFKSLIKEYAAIFFIALGFILFFLFKDQKILFISAVLGSIPFVLSAFQSLSKRKINIAVFNLFALIVAFLTREVQSAAFIILMLTFAEILDQYNEFRSHKAVEELLKLKPLKALRETANGTEEVGVDDIKENDIVVVPTGARIPVDGIITFGKAFIDESPLTGESMPVEKIVGDSVLSSTLNESGAIKFRAIRVGKNSTIERMVALIKEASKNKSQPEKLADKFAQIFLPIVLVLGIATYLITKNIGMTAAIFLVACADDMSVAIPLAITASLGQAAKRGVIIKGGAWLDRLGKIKTLVLDKTGTLTYGKISLKDVYIDPQFKENDFWLMVGIGEKYSEHPAGRAVFKKAFAFLTEGIPDPEVFSVQKGTGVIASSKGHQVIIGNENIITENNFQLANEEKKVIEDWGKKYGETVSLVFIDKKFAGLLVLSDIPRTEAGLSLQKARELGVQKIGMLTGDNETVAKNLSDALQLDFYQAKINPENKLGEIKKLIDKKDGIVAMVGDGINDGPALAQADVSIAMGSGGTAVAAEAADVVILTDDLSRIPEMIALGKKTMSVIKIDGIIWLISNIVGFALVWTGKLDPVYAAFYNFITDFFPLLNSIRLFKSKTKIGVKVKI